MAHKHKGADLSSLAHIHPEEFVQKAFAGLPLREELLQPLHGREAIEEEGVGIVNLPRCQASTDIISDRVHTGKKVRNMSVTIESEFGEGELPEAVSQRLEEFNVQVRQIEPEEVRTHGRVCTNIHGQPHLEVKVRRKDGLTRQDKEALVSAANDLYDMLNPE
ncbi:MAG: hypothetical protein ABH851_09050 [Methanobacteriota archaeon]